jgi:hypothetical protein
MIVVVAPPTRCNLSLAKSEHKLGRVQCAMQRKPGCSSKYLLSCMKGSRTFLIFDSSHTAMSIGSMWSISIDARDSDIIYKTSSQFRVKQRKRTRASDKSQEMQLYYQHYL